MIFTSGDLESQLSRDINFDWSHSDTILCDATAHDFVIESIQNEPPPRSRTELPGWPVQQVIPNSATRTRARGQDFYWIPHNTLPIKLRKGIALVPSFSFRTVFIFTARATHARAPWWCCRDKLASIYRLLRITYNQRRSKFVQKKYRDVETGQQEFQLLQWRSSWNAQKNPLVLCTKQGCLTLVWLTFGCVHGKSKAFQILWNVTWANKWIEIAGSRSWQSSPKQRTLSIS